MLFLKKPSSADITSFLVTQSKLGFSYPAVGATAMVPPSLGFNVDHARVLLGKGERVFTAARMALERWDHFRLDWVEAAYPETSIRVGGVVAVVGRSFGIWCLNACRIVYVVDEDGPVKRFGFAYGTLPGHIEIGEERFLIEWDRQDDSVTYDILAFSRPHGVLARLSYLWLRRMQECFRRDSGAAMMRATSGVAD